MYIINIDSVNSLALVVDAMEWIGLDWADWSGLDCSRSGTVPVVCLKEHSECFSFFPSVVAEKKQRKPKNLQ